MAGGRVSDTHEFCVGVGDTAVNAVSQLLVALCIHIDQPLGVVARSDKLFLRFTTCWLRYVVRRCRRNAIGSAPAIFMKKREEDLSTRNCTGRANSAVTRLPPPPTVNGAGSATATAVRSGPGGPPGAGWLRPAASSPSSRHNHNISSQIHPRAPGACMRESSSVSVWHSRR